MDGVALAREIRRRWPKLPVVLTSGYSDVLVEEVGHGFPMLAKPYDLDALADALRSAIGDDDGSVGPRKSGLRPEVLKSMLSDAQQETRRHGELDSMHILDTPP